jgi:WD40 repeat protein
VVKYFFLLLESGIGEFCPTLKGDAIFSTIRMEAFSPNSQFLAFASDDKTVKVWDITTNIPHRAIQGHSIDVDAVSFSLDGKVLVPGSVDGTIGIWNVSTGSLSHMLHGHSSGVEAVAFHLKSHSRLCIYR